MANIIRCVLPDGVHRFKPFKVSDYRDFLLIRNDMLSKSDEDQAILVNELAEEYFHEFPKSWQQYLFLNVFTGSIGKTRIPITYTCPICGKVHKKLFSLSQNELNHPTVIIDESLELIFNFPDKVYDNLELLVFDNIKEIISNNIRYKWNELTDSTKENVIEMITFEVFEELVKKLKPLYFELDVSCCEKKILVYDDLVSIFKLLINPDEVFPFYEINHILIKNNYDLNSIMNMLPAERSIALSLIEKDKTK